MTISSVAATAQVKPAFVKMPALPDDKGFAGMYAGVSDGILFCMGGANFPGELPWKGGKKKWYDNIFMLEPGGTWVKLRQKLPLPAAYGLSASHGNEIIVAGGCNSDMHFNTVTGYTWNGSDFNLKNYPHLPLPLAYMAGGIIKNTLIVTGGSVSAGVASAKCYALPLDNNDARWTELEEFPGGDRILAVGAVYDDRLFLFSGETTRVNLAGDSAPLILQDAYRLELDTSQSIISGKWTKLACMPKGTAATANPAPVLKNGNMIFWGGVDAVARLHEDPANYPGISGDILIYDPRKDKWSYAGKEISIPARVTLPTVLWNGRWVYINGETRPGIRTNQVTAFKNY